MEVWYLVEGKSKQDTWELNYDLRMESSYTPEVGQLRYIASLVSWKQIASSVPYGQGWTIHIHQVNSGLPGTEECVHVLKQ